jgi:hypothetical protein
MSVKNSFISFLSQVTHLGDDRYVSEFNRPPVYYEEGRSEVQNDEEQDILDSLKQSGQHFIALTEKHDVLNRVEETIFVSIRDCNDFRVTIYIKQGGEVNFRVGWDTSVRPTLQVDLLKQNVKNLEAISKNDSLDTKEMYRIARVLFVPFLRGLYDAEYLYEPGDKRYLKLDNIFHVELVDEQGVDVMGFHGTAKATVTNVNGEWIVTEGFHGTPRAKVECDLQQGLEFYYIIRIMMRDAESLSEAETAFNRYMELRAETTEDLYSKN